MRIEKEFYHTFSLRKTIALTKKKFSASAIIKEMGRLKYLKFKTISQCCLTFNDFHLTYA